MLAFLFVWPWWVTLAGALAVIVGLLLVADEVADVLGWWLVVPGAVVILFFGVFALTVSVGRHYSRVTCHRFHDTTGRPTRFVIYNIGATACLTRSGSTWLPIDQLREFGSGR